MLTNIPADVDRDHIKVGFDGLATGISYIEINKEDSTACVRLRGEDSGKLVQLLAHLV
jgi:hypothetical protein